MKVAKSEMLRINAAPNCETKVVDPETQNFKIKSFKRFSCCVITQKTLLFNVLYSFNFHQKQNRLDLALLELK